MWFNHFPFRFDQWLPDDWPELGKESLQKAVEYLLLTGQSWPRLYDAVDNSEAKKQLKIRLLRSACCLFWQVFYWPDRFTAAQLEELRNVWQYHHETDDPLDWMRAYINIHISAAQAVLLYGTKGSSPETVHELINSITRLAGQLKSTNSIPEPGALYANDPQYFNESVPMFRSLFAVCSLGWCFSFHMAKADNKPEIAFEYAFEALNVAQSANITHVFFTEPNSVIEENNIIISLAVLWIGSQDIVDVVDEICLAVNPEIDWQDLANRCYEMRFLYEEAVEKALKSGLRIDQFVNSKMGKLKSGSEGELNPSYPISEFWTFARGLCITRLSPDAYRKLRDTDERHAAQDRLKRYFFSDLWEEMPSESREALITADRTYWSTEGRKGDILENIRLAIEPVIEKQLAVPFRSWCSQNSKKASGNSSNQDRETFLRLTKLLHELWDDRRLFNDFARAAFPETKDIFWEDLRKTLYSLRDTRSATAHPDEKGPATTEQMLAHYRKFIGIGEKGIFIELLNLHPKQM